MSDPRIAVIIVNFNAGEYLRQCLEALAGQTRSPDKILVVDNASTDSSLSGLKDAYPSVEWTELESNRGFAAANNLAVARAEDCEWVVLLNPDAFPEKDWLRHLQQAAQAHPEFSCFGSRMLSHQRPDFLDGTGDVYHISGLAWRRDHGQPAKRLQRESGEVFSPCAAAALYRRADFIEAGGFDEGFFTYFEDVDLGFRLRLRGKRSYYVHNALVRHVGWGTTQRQSRFSLYYGHRNLVWSFFKNMPAPLLWRCLPHHLLQNLLSLIWFTLKGKGGTIFRSKWDALCMLPGILRQRRAVQQMRSVPASDLWQAMNRDSWAPLARLRKRVKVFS